LPSRAKRRDSDSRPRSSARGEINHDSFDYFSF
jgi:hypothetical protein